MTYNLTFPSVMFRRNTSCPSGTCYWRTSSILSWWACITRSRRLISCTSYWTTSTAERCVISFALFVCSSWSIGPATPRLWVRFLGKQLRLNPNTRSREKNCCRKDGKTREWLKNRIVNYVGDSGVDADRKRISCHEKQRGAAGLRIGNSPQETLGRGESDLAGSV